MLKKAFSRGAEIRFPEDVSVINPSIDRTAPIADPPVGTIPARPLS
jgi:hypothetical protein